LIFQYTDYRVFLRDALVTRSARRRGYSLRRFAKTLGVSPSFLSDLLRGRKSLSPEKAGAVARRLGLTGTEAEYFRLLARHRSEGGASEDPAGPRVVTRLPLDAFTAMRDWYHVAILEMTELEHFQVTAATVAARLSIGVRTARAALARLVRIGHLAVDEQGRFRKTYRAGVLESAERNDALRAFHEQMLRKAASSLTGQTNTEKVVGSETFAFAPEQLPLAAAIIEDCFNKMTALAEQSAGRSQVYHLGIQLFNLTTGKAGHASSH
jgi:uncharacterized protein (TIGR02147 family)